jgi:hypothetical protein
MGKDKMVGVKGRRREKWRRKGIMVGKGGEGREALRMGTVDVETA